MATARAKFHIQSYDIIKHLRHEFRGRLNAHLDSEFFVEHGVEVSKFELEDDEHQEGLYYEPMLRRKLCTLGESRPEVDVRFFFEEAKYCCSGDSDGIIFDINEQIESMQGSVSTPNLTGWDRRIPTRKYERNLHEMQRPCAVEDPTEQHDWDLVRILESRNQPHQICLSTHEVNNVTGLIRSEMIILTSLMLAKMMRTDIELYHVYPVLMLSVIGRRARMIQAHICPVRQRLVVRHSRFFNFTDCSQELMDMFVRWLLSTPLSNELNDTKVADDRFGHGGDTAPQIKAQAPPPPPPPTQTVPFRLRTGASAQEIAEEQTATPSMPSLAFAA